MTETKPADIDHECTDSLGAIDIRDLLLGPLQVSGNGNWRLPLVRDEETGRTTFLKLIITKESHWDVATIPVEDSESGGEGSNPADSRNGGRRSSAK